jgi:hypothetical protein
MATTIIRGTQSNRLRFNLGTTGLSHSTSGLVISTICDNEATATAYTQAAGTIETVTTLGTYATPTSGRCRFREVDATNHSGLYEFHFADARLAVANSCRLVITVSGGGLTTAVHYEVDLKADASVQQWLGSVVNALNAGRVPVRVEQLADSVIDVPHVTNDLIATIQSGLSTEADATANREAVIDAIELINGSKGSGIYTDTVTDTAAQPVEGADVWLTPVGQTTPRVDATTTNSLGQFTLRADPGQYSLHVQRSGKQSQTVTITIT